jgi:O-antigen/teichoic acid export membrane protein
LWIASTNLHTTYKVATLKTNFIYNILLAVSQILFPLITFPYASRILLPQGIGSVSFVDNFTQYFITFAALGIPVYGVREIAKRQQVKEERSKLFSELVVIHFSLSLIVTILYWIIVINTEKFQQDLFLCKIGVVLLISNVFTIEWLYQGLEKFKFVVIRTILIRIVTIIALFSLVKSVDDREFYYGLNILGTVTSAVINLYVARKYVNFHWKGLELRKHLKPLIVLLSTSIVISVYILLDTILLGFLTNNEIVGYYSASIRISKLPLAVVGALGTVLIPRLTNSMTLNIDNSNSLLEKSLHLSLLISIPIAIGTLCLSKEIVTVFAGVKFIHAVPSLQILSCVVIIIGIAQVYGQQVLLPIGKENYILIASSIGMIFSILLNLFLIPSFLHIGAAMSSLFTEIVVAIILFIFSRKFLTITFPKKEFLTTSITCIFFFPIKEIIKLYTDDVLITLLSTITICGIVYVFCQVFIWKNTIMKKLVFNFLKVHNS